MICDKPMAISLREALEVERAAQEGGVVFALTHNYSSYPMVLEARHLVRAGEVGQLDLEPVDAGAAEGARA